MPFENVHGNGGLLTTVGDLLRWNENFVTPRVGDAEFVHADADVPGMLGSGGETGYAYGLAARELQGTREVRHSGTTGELSGLPDPVSGASTCPSPCCATPATACRDRRCTPSPNSTSAMR